MSLQPVNADKGNNQCGSFNTATATMDLSSRQCFNLECYAGKMDQSLDEYIHKANFKVKIG